MAKKRTKNKTEQDEDQLVDDDGDDGEVLVEGKLICALTGEQMTANSKEELLQSFIEQLHREYGVALEDMDRDASVSCESYNEKKGKVTSRTHKVSLAVYEPGAEHTVDNLIRAVLVAPPNTKADGKLIEQLDEILSNLSSEREQVFGLWSNGNEMAFRMRTYNARTGEPQCIDLTDFPAPGESLEDLEEADRRPLRVAAGDSLLRTFKRCHDYLYGNQSMRGDKAFWQLLQLIFCKIYDEAQSKRRFFVGATEAYDKKGQAAVAKRITELFDEVRNNAYADVFDGNERIELNERALAYVASEIGRYYLLGTDTDAKGMAYEAITSNTLKRERGQFFTPRNVIRMMVEMADPKPGQLVLDPACGSGGFLVVALNHVRKQILRDKGLHPDLPVPSELKRIEKPLKKYAETCLFGIDVDRDLRKAARMNMVMNNDGHGNIFNFNSLEYGVPALRRDEMGQFEKRGGGHGKFDFVFTNPPFGSKIPVSDPDILGLMDLGHSWSRGDTWVRGARQKKVPPEILFIEACRNFLKPGTGMMAIVLPNGILGNPGEQMEAVRVWMLEQMELLASVDLPAEAFLPQVSVQASCVFLRRRHPDELRMKRANGPKQRPVFMGIAENCGHGRRGEPRWVRNPDGTDKLTVREELERYERRGKVVEVARQKQVRELADDMPWIAEQYRERLARGELK